MAIKSILFDASFIIPNVGKSLRYGIFRVEKAWLDYLVSRKDLSIYFSFRREGKVSILGPEHTEHVSAILDDPSSLRLGALERLVWKLGRPRRAVKLEVRRRARATVAESSEDLSRIVRSLMPGGGWFLSFSMDPGADAFLRNIQLGGLKTAIMLHDTIPLDHPEVCAGDLDKMLERIIRHQAQSGDLLLCNSADTAESFNLHARRLKGGDPLARPVIAHLGLHKAPSHIQGSLPQPLKANEPFFLILGTIEPRKNHLFLLNVWQRMMAQNRAAVPRLVIAGRWGWKVDDIRRQLEAFAQAHPEAMTILESPDDATVAALLAETRGMLMPSIAEGFGLPVLEALREGIPVIANDLAVYREIAGDAPDLCSTDDPEGWARLIESYARQKVRVQPPHIPTWDEHFEIVMAAMSRAA